MELRILHCWLVLFGFWAFVSTSLSENTVNPEVRVLKDVMESLDPDYNVFRDFNLNDFCTCWPIVNCSFDGHVTAIVYTSEWMRLSGTISRSIGNLTYLQTLLLPNNNLSGTIPSEIGMLQKIETIDLSHNLLIGEIPSSLSQLKALQYLVLSNNNLSGTIPSEIGMLQKIEAIDLSNNLLTGKIPSSLSQLKAIQYLDLSFNNLSCPVPRLPAKKLYVLGNPMICASGIEPNCNGTTAMPAPISLNNSHSLQPSPRLHKVALAMGLSLGSAFVLIAGIGSFLWWRQHKKIKDLLQRVNSVEKESDGEACLGNLRRFQFSELEIATNSFSSQNILGKGGFGNVYKGNLKDGSIVAVKRLKTDNEIRGEIQFQTEVKLISHAVHRNILRLYGFCITTTERLLVYPYMSNGSVASCLKAKSPLDWQTRKRIALGAARGLLYLHEQCDSKIIHRDVKAANILLDDNCEAVVGDFGLAKLLGHPDSHVTTAVRGTVGHIAPEYLSTGQSSEKTDVFGYGIFLLELITGQRATEFLKAANLKGHMLDWVKKIHQEKKLEMLVDKKLNNNYDSSELKEMTKVALLCTLHDPNHRPKMCEVVGILQGDGDELAEKWKSSQSVEAKRCKENECSSSERPHDFTDDSSSLLVKAVEILRGWKRMGNL